MQCCQSTADTKISSLQAISDASLAKLGCLTKLRRLDLKHYHDAQLSPSAFEFVSRLMDLRSCTYITSAAEGLHSVRMFARLSQLTCLHTSHMSAHVMLWCSTASA